MIQRILFIFTWVTSISLACSGVSFANPSYVGGSSCSGCHKIAMVSWEMTAHAKAYESLKPGVKKQEKLKAHLDPNKDYTSDKACLKCHTTGYQAVGGFKNIESTSEMAGVGCESCHGPGSEYKALHEKRKVNFTKKEAKALGALYSSEDPVVCNSCHLGKDVNFTEAIDKKYKFDRQKEINTRKSVHKKDSR